MTKKKVLKKSSKKFTQASIDKLVDRASVPEIIKVKAIVSGPQMAIGPTVPGTEIEISKTMYATILESQRSYLGALEYVASKIKEAAETI